MAKILLVEDDEELAVMLTTSLGFDHLQVEWVSDGSEGLSYLKSYCYDAVILDWQLPGMNGPEICKLFREGGGETPILMLTAKNQVLDKETGLDAGADDYLTKPFDMKELSARVRALLRRAGTRLSGNVLAVGDIALDPFTFQVIRAGVHINAVAKEFALLELFMRHPGQVFSTETLINRIWLAGDDVSPETVRTHIKNLRKKLCASGQRDVIHNCRGVGYKLDFNQIAE